MTTHHLLNKMARLGIQRDHTRVLLSLAEHGKTIIQIRKENPGLSPDIIPDLIPRGHLKRQRIGRPYVYRLTEKGMNTVKLLFDEETAPAVHHAPDSPPLPFE